MDSVSVQSEQRLTSCIPSGSAGRLKPGISLTQANAQLKLASQAAQRQGLLPDPDYEFVLEPLRDAIVKDARSSLLLMQAAVGLVLLIACANVANLLLGSRYRSPARICDSSRHRGGSRTAASPVCDRERVAVFMRRRSRSGDGVSSAYARCFDQSWQHSAHWRCGRCRGT